MGFRRAPRSPILPFSRVSWKWKHPFSSTPPYKGFFILFALRYLCRSASPQELDDTAVRTADPAGDVNHVRCCHSDQDRAHVESRQDKAPIIITSEDSVFLDLLLRLLSLLLLLGISCGLRVEVHGSTLPWQNVCPTCALSLAFLRYASLGGMVDTKSTMGAREHWQAAAGRGSEAAVLKSAPTAAIALPHARSLLLPELVNSATDSEGTVFFEAHEEIPWTPDRPSRRSPAGIAARRVQLAVWSQQQGDNPVTVDPESKDVAPIQQQPRDPKAYDDGLEEEAMARKGQAAANAEHEVGASNTCAGRRTEREGEREHTSHLFSP